MYSRSLYRGPSRSAASDGVAKQSGNAAKMATRFMEVALVYPGALTNAVKKQRLLRREENGLQFAVGHA